MNTILNILNILKHIVVFIFYVLFTIAVLTAITISIYLSSIILWLITMFFIGGYFCSLITAINSYKKLWKNKGSFIKSFIYLITKK